MMQKKVCNISSINNLLAECVDVNFLIQMLIQTRLLGRTEQLSELSLLTACHARAAVS